MDQALLPLLLVALASVFQGTFGLGMKKTAPLKWAAWWLLYAAIAMVVAPWVWAVAAVPDLWGSIAGAPRGAVALGAFFGFLWGIGGILFGLGVSHIGMSLTYGIVMGLAGSIGSLAPLFQTGGGGPAVPYVLLGVGVMAGGVAVVAWAGVKRDRAAATAGMEIAGVRKGRGFQKGLLIAVLSGILSALLNVGFANAAPVAETAISHGANPRNASLAAWVVVLAGAFVMNAGYAIILLVKRRRGAPEAAERSPWTAAGWAVLTGILWFAALGVYGQGAALMGTLGPVIGWPILLGLALIVSNLWAVASGEWRGAREAMSWMFAGVAILITACALLGYSNSL